MNFGYLRDIFASYAWKQLTPVEVDPNASHGHEFNGSSQLREILGTTTRKCKEGTGFPTRCFYFADDADETIESTACLSWYDSRVRHATRTEWRLYYTDNSVFGTAGRASAGDILIIAFSAGLENATAIAAAAGSTSESQLRWLFGIQVDDDEGSGFAPATVADDAIVDGTRARILEALGLELPAKDETLLMEMLQRFHGEFPRAHVFSEFVRAGLPDVRAEDGADAALLAWMEKEEFAFRVLERHLVGDRIKSGFKDVDDFVACSLSIQNRRKSRAGRAFENHLSEVFCAYGLAFEQGAQVENKARPDFLFPGAEQYFDEAFPIAWLTILGAKTSCKDRWRQVLAEGKRLRDKYLVTLEPAISGNQLAEMRDAALQLVVPSALHSTYPAIDRSWLCDVGSFIDLVHTRQKQSGARPQAPKIKAERQRKKI